MRCTCRVQFMAPHFAEATLLRTAAALEQQQFEDGMPKPVCNVMVNPIQGEKGLHPLALEMTKKLWSKKYGHSTATTL
jgi:acetylornithine/succinyldiaminopimelate/putrescine aminotransferase